MNVIANIYNSEKSAYGSNFVSCNRHLEITRRSLNKSGSPCFVNVLGKTKVNCDCCQDEESESSSWCKHWDKDKNGLWKRSPIYPAMGDVARDDWNYCPICGSAKPAPSQTHIGNTETHDG